MEINNNLKNKFYENTQAYFANKEPVKLPSGSLDIFINSDDFNQQELDEIAKSNELDQIISKINPPFHELNELISDVNKLLSEFPLLAKEIPNFIFSFNLILFLNKLMSVSSFRQLYKHLPTNDKYKDIQARKKCKNLKISPECFKEIKQSIPTYLNYDLIHQLASETKIFNLSSKNKYFYEYVFYVSSKELFKMHIDQYWKYYIDFLNLTYKHIGTLFNKKISNLCYSNIAEIKIKLLQYQKIIESQSIEINQFRD